jgi:competence protein ComEA
MKGALCVLAMLGGVAAMGQGKLPDGEGKETVLKVCSKCHGPEVVMGRGHTRDEWEGVVVEMVNAGAEGTDAEFISVVDYLTKNFPKKIQVNKASATELGNGLEISAKEAESIVKYREENGKFKELDDLKKVPGLDFKKVEAKKEKLAF